MTPLKILVVDDDRNHADSLGELFAMEGHHVEVAYSGEEGIAAYDRSEFDLGLMDVMMPGKDGVESFLEIRRRHPTANIYMMSGYSVEHLLRLAAANGALGLLSKLIEPRRLIEVLESVQPSGIVLVAEDTPDIGKSMRELIVTSGKTCELATNGREALERVSSGGVDVLILDLNTPLIDGIGVYSTLRERGLVLPTIIIITGGGEHHKDALSSLTEFEMTGILTKPYEPEVLINQLQRMVSGARR